LKLRIEKTTSWQVEGPGESYCATVYSRSDAELVRQLARGISKLRCLKETGSGKQVKGIYLYKGGEPLVEVYDKRLAKRVGQHISEIRGD
jgi:hypothetical protein